MARTLARHGSAASKPTPAPNVESVKTSLTIRTAKHEPGVPLG